MSKNRAEILFYGKFDHLTLAKIPRMKNVFAVLLVFGMISCQAQTENSKKVDPEVFEKGLSSEGVQVLDVRTSGEYSSGHLQHALQADWTNKSQFFDRVQYMDKSKPVYIYCLGGGRSAAAATWMRSNGFSSVVELTGKPVEGHADVPQMTLEQYNASIPTDKTVLVDFGATWCPPCVAMAPVLDSLQKDPQLHFELLKIDAGVHTDLMKAMNIDKIPYFLVYKNGKMVWDKDGIVSREKLIKQLQ